MPSAAINTSTPGDNVIVPGSPGVILRVTGYVLSAAGHNLVQWASGLLSGGGAGLALGGAALAVISGQDDVYALPATVAAPLAPLAHWGQLGWFETRAGDPLVLNLADPQLVMGHVSYVTVSSNNPAI